LVTETAIAPDGGLAEVVARDRRVPIMVGVPVVFSPNLENATYVTGVLPGVDSRELFRIEPRPDGAVHLLSHQSGLTVNDAPIDGTRPTSIDLREAVRIRLGSRLFSIIGSFAQPGHPGAGQSIFEAGPLHN
jgi:hypothetical protein